MRIAMVSEHASPLATVGGVDAGGQNVHVAALADALGARGHQVSVYTRRDDPDAPDSVRMARGVTVHHVPAGPPEPIAKDEIFPHLDELAAGLHRSWRAGRPDVVHAHFWMSGLAALEAAEPLDVPVVQTFHALGSVKRRHQGDRDTSPAERPELEAAITRRCRRVVATCSDEVFELMSMGADVDRVSIVPCGVDTDLFTPEGPAWNRPEARHRLVTVGRLVERKGVDDVISALRHIPDAELVVAGGPDPDGLRTDPDARRLSALAAECGVSGRVRFAGRLGRASVAALLRGSDLAVCVPWYEPFGIVPLEAMSCAVPVIASNVGGLADTVVHGVTGLHVPPRSPFRLAEAVNSLLRDRRRRRDMGRAGRIRAVERYRWQAVAAATLSAYREALAGATSDRRVSERRVASR